MWFIVGAMREQQSPVEDALAELNNNLAVARTQEKDHVTLPKQTAVWVRDLLEDLETDTHLHVHIENNRLFPLAVALDATTPARTSGPLR